MPQNETISKFVAAITREAQKKRSRIEQETQEYIRRELDKAENEVLHEAYEMIQRRTAALRSDVGRELSREQLAFRRELSLRRDEIADEVFDAARERFAAFTASESYEAFLLQSARAAAAALPDAEGCTVLVREADLRFADALRAAVVGCEVCADDSVRLGGAKARSRDGSLCADDTLDLRLREQRAWFRENCGLSLQGSGTAQD